MELPIVCRENLNHLTEHADLARLRMETAAMTEAYQTGSGRGKVLVSSRDAVLAYAAVRMPATYAADRTALSWVCETLPGETEITSVLDLGAGTGAGIWAVSETFPEVSVTAVEREREMISVGRALLEGSGIPVTWLCADAGKALEDLVREGKQFDLVMASYMTNELSEKERERLLPLLWAVTGKLLLLIEPGTKTGSGILRSARKTFTELGAHIAAPCPELAECPIAEGDWCHFTARAARSKLHKLLKGGDVPYEDEKFSYLACVRGNCTPCEARILRHPYRESGRITLTLCSADGWETKTVTKRDKAFGEARKADCGDAFHGN